MEAEGKFFLDGIGNLRVLAVGSYNSLSFEFVAQVSQVSIERARYSRIAGRQ